MCQKQLIVTQTWITNSRIKMKNTTGTHTRLYEPFVLLQICEKCLKIHWVIYEHGPCVLFLSSLPRSSFSCFSAVKWTSLPLRGRVTRLPVVVRLCMNQSGDRAAGWMADATARKLFNQAALPNRGQGETLQRRMKEKEPQPHGTHILHACTHVHRLYFNPAH